jgi:FkbM family methyltransferase
MHLMDAPAISQPCSVNETKRLGPVAAIGRAAAILTGFANYGNPFHILLRRLLTKDGVMTISDRQTGVSVRALRQSYHMFSETWYLHDYDVAACPIRSGDVVVDIGANQGFFTCYAAQRGAKVYAFEPHPTMFDLLGRNVQHNQYGDRVSMDRVAIADFDGETDLLCSPLLGGGANTINREHARAIHASQKQLSHVRVPVKRLCSAIPRDLRVRLLKIDCEGAELAILRDLQAPERFDSMAIEFHPDAYPAEALIRSILDFGTHQVFAPHGHIVHAIRTETLLEHAKTIR